MFVIVIFKFDFVYDFVWVFLNIYCWWKYLIIMKIKIKYFINDEFCVYVIFYDL